MPGTFDTEVSEVFWCPDPEDTEVSNISSLMAAEHPSKKFPWMRAKKSITPTTSQILPLQSEMEMRSERLENSIMAPRNRAWATEPSGQLDLGRRGRVQRAPRPVRGRGGARDPRSPARARLRRNPPGGASAEVSRLVCQRLPGSWVSSEGGNLSEKLPSPRHPRVPVSSSFPFCRLLFVPSRFPRTFHSTLWVNWELSLRPQAFHPVPSPHLQGWSRGFWRDQSPLSASLPSAVAKLASEDEEGGRPTPLTSPPTTPPTTSTPKPGFCILGVGHTLSRTQFTSYSLRWAPPGKWMPTLHSCVLGALREGKVLRGCCVARPTFEVRRVYQCCCCFKKQIRAVSHPGELSYLASPLLLSAQLAGWGGARGVGSEPAEGTAAHPPGSRSWKSWSGEGIADLETRERGGSGVLAEVAASPLTVRELWEIVSGASGLT